MNALVHDHRLYRVRSASNLRARLACDVVLPLTSRAVASVLFIVVGLGVASCGGGVGGVTDALTLPAVADLTYTANVTIAAQTLPAAAGGTPPYAYTLTPVPGLTFNPATRTLTGTPTTAGTYPLIYTATDAAGTAATQSFTLTVPPPDGGGEGVTPEPPPVMFANALPPTFARSYTANIAIAALTLPAAAGGTSPYTYKLHPAAGEVSPNPNGTLTPAPGVTFAPATRTLTGNPTTAGTYPLIYTATDATGTAAAQSFTLTVAAALRLPAVAALAYTSNIAIAALTLPAAAGGTSPYAYTLTPAPGLTFDPATRTLTGAPTTAGTYPLLYTATDAAGTAATQSFTLTVAGDLTLPAIADRTYPENADIRWRSPAAIGGTAPYTYTLHPAAGEVTPNADGSLTPVPGLTFHPSFLTFVGQPTTTGTYPLIYTATDATGTAVAQSFTLTVADALTLPTVADLTYTANVAIAALTLPAAAGGVSPYTYILHPAAGDVSPNPNGTLTPVPGLTFDPAPRTLTGTPTMAGTYPLLYTATDATGTDAVATPAAQSFTLTVAAGQTPPDGGGGATPDPPAQAGSCPDRTSTDSTDTVYRLTFQSRWTRANFPTNFPNNAHFSPLVGAVHDASNGFWDMTMALGMASPGIESMAETGSAGTLVSEINAVSPTTAYTGSSIGSNNIGGSTTLDFRVNPDCPVVTFVSMLAPSHDWFVGVGGSQGFDLRNAEGAFVEKTSHLLLYDAGTEEGDDFGFSGAMTIPQEPIRPVTTPAEATDFERGHHRDASSEPEGNVATFKFEIIQAATSTSLLRLTAAPATIAEGEASTVTVALAEAAPAGGMPLTLTFAGTADSDDYRASATAVTIPAGATTATFTMTALLDDIDDPVETIIITAAGATMTADTTMTIEGEPAIANQLNRVILPEVARAIADTTVTAITRRLAQAASDHDTSAFTLGGHTTLADVLRTGGRVLADTGDLDVSALLGQSSFVLPLLTGGGGWGERLAFWGGGDYRALGGSGDAVDWDGELLSAHVGADTRLGERLVAGAALSWTQSDIQYGAIKDIAIKTGGTYEMEMTSVHPYVAWDVLPGRLDMWASAGYGWGELAVNDQSMGARHTTDTVLRTAGIGGSGRLLDTNMWTLRLKGDAVHTTVDVSGRDVISAVAVEARRLRMGIESAHTHVFANGALLNPSVEVGMRHDGGDGRTGAGSEIGGGLRYTDPARRLTLASRGRALLGHTGDYDDWGVGGILTITPGPAGQGLAFTLSPTYGQTVANIEQVWHQNAGDLAGADAATSGHHVDAELGYGLAAPGWGASGLLTPYSRMTLGAGTHTYRLGSRLTFPAGLSLTLEGMREATDALRAARVKQSILVHAEYHW